MKIFNRFYFNLTALGVCNLNVMTGIWHKLPIARIQMVIFLCVAFIHTLTSFAFLCFEAQTIKEYLTSFFNGITCAMSFFAYLNFSWENTELIAILKTYERTIVASMSGCDEIEFKAGINTLFNWYSSAESKWRPAIYAETEAKLNRYFEMIQGVFLKVLLPVSTLTNVVSIAIKFFGITDSLISPQLPYDAT